MRRVAWLFAVGAALCAPIAPEKLSVKPSIGPAGSGTRVSRGRIAADDAPLRLIITLAYEMGEARVAAPEWTASERYDVAVTAADAPVMLRRKVAEASGVVDSGILFPVSDDAPSRRNRAR